MKTSLNRNDCCLSNIFILVWIVVFLHDLVGPSSAFGRILGTIGLSFVACEVIAYTIGLVGTLLIIYGFGLLVESRIGDRLQKLIENALDRLPLVSTVYDASKQLTNMFDSGNKNMAAMTPVMWHLGGKGGTAMLALMPILKTVNLNGQDFHVVMIPTAPVPIGGALFCVPVDWIEPAACSMEGVVSIFMPMGVSAPDYLGVNKEMSTDPRSAIEGQGN